MSKTEAYFTAKKIVNQKFGRDAVEKMDGDTYDRLVLGYTSKLLLGKCDSAGKLI